MVVSEVLATEISEDTVTEAMEATVVTTTPATTTGDTANAMETATIIAATPASIKSSATDPTDMLEAMKMAPTKMAPTGQDLTETATTRSKAARIRIWPLEHDGHLLLLSYTRLKNGERVTVLDKITTAWDNTSDAEKEETRLVINIIK